MGTDPSKNAALTRADVTGPATPSARRKNRFEKPIGKQLRLLYEGALAEPMPDRLQALLDKLQHNSK